MTYDSIPQYLVEEYKAALIEITLNEKQIEMLNLQYNAPEYSVTASELSEELGYTNHNPVNSQYGNIGKSIAHSLGKEITIQSDGYYHWWRIIAEGTKTEKGFIWKMKPNFLKALYELEIVGPS